MYAFPPGGANLRRLVLGLVVPVLAVALWQVLGSMPRLSGVLPTPLAVLGAWEQWLFGKPGLGLNPYLGTWLANVEYSA